MLYMKDSETVALDEQHLDASQLLIVLAKRGDVALPRRGK